MEILMQSKLSKSEWDSLEVPIPSSEKQILDVIKNGYSNPSIVLNRRINMIEFSKLKASQEMHFYIYTKYFEPYVQTMYKYQLDKFVINSRTVKKLKTADMIRVQNIDNTISLNKDRIYEFMCLELCKNIIKDLSKNKSISKDLYTLIEWNKAVIPNTNPHVKSLIQLIILKCTPQVSIKDIVVNSTNIIEKNTNLFKCENISLFSHQKDIYSFCRLHRDVPKLILYTAPTGTGKTLTPIGLSEGNKIIFVCVARHVGLALAKCAITLEKKIAFAFGCETADDIRLHYFSALDYTRNRKSGGIGKVDNSNGSAVEIMICDVQSYLIAMYYMASFNKKEDILTYWDEPTMTLDYEDHVLHNNIHDLWSKNQIPNLVLSCATLPKEEDIQDCIQDFRMNFLGSVVHTITSYDCKKSIPIITSEGQCFMPHIHCEDLNQLREYVRFASNEKTLFRYFDLDEVINFVLKFHEKIEGSSNIHMNNYFNSITEINMNSLKMYYLELLTQIEHENWEYVHNSLKIGQKTKFEKNINSKNNHLRRVESMPNEPNQQCSITRTLSEGESIKNQQTILDRLSGVLLTTNDAHTLTDGPTIYLADNLINLAKFYVHQSNIPNVIMNHLVDNIKNNDNIHDQIRDLEEKLQEKIQVKDNEDKTNEGKDAGKNKKKTPTKEKKGFDENTQVLKDNINSLKRRLTTVNLESSYIPNSNEHQQKWAYSKIQNQSPFSSTLDESTIRDIMDMEIDSNYKILVLMGIGVLIKHEHKKYEETVKRLAQEQKLYLILTSSDYIYGTNYQFCHGFIGKDLPNMTRQKILQCLGRVGRNSTQQDYTVRFRNNDMIHNLFKADAINMEANNMNRLLCHYN